MYETTITFDFDYIDSLLSDWWNDIVDDIDDETTLRFEEMFDSFDFEYNNLSFDFEEDYQLSFQSPIQIKEDDFQKMFEEYFGKYSKEKINITITKM